MEGKEENKPHSGIVMLAVFITAIFALIAGGIAFNYAADAFREANNLPPVNKSFLGWHWSTEREVTFAMLGASTVLIKVILPAVLYGLLHPVIGKPFSVVAESLSNRLDSILGLDGEFGNSKANTLIMLGVLWPFTLILILLLLIAVILSSLYKALW